MRKHWYLDAGHGYDTPGKRSTRWPDGSQLFEFEYNRAIVLGLAALLDKDGIHYDVINNRAADMSLANRVLIANTNLTDRPPVFVSVHGNGFSNESAEGFEVFTSPGNTDSDKIATILIEYLKSYFPDEKHRSDFSDGDADKEAKFYVLRKTKCPAILSENGFFTNKAQCFKMMSSDWRLKIIKAHYDMITEVENHPDI